MNWTGTLLFLIGFVAFQRAAAEDTDLNELSKVQDESQTNLNTNLRSALLQVLTDLENEKDDETERDVEKAQASAVTIFANNLNISSTPSKDKLLEEPSSNLPESQFLILPINSSTTDHEDEHIITSASSSFVSEPPETKEVVQFQKKGGFKNLNSIPDDEPKKPSKLVEKFSIGKNVEEPFIQTFVKPLGNDVEDDNKAVYVQTSKSQNSDTKVVTEPPVEVSTEENEAKIEQVQFFTAPLVAAFTVHQDETGLPKKVEPIYKTEPEPVEPQVQLQTSQSSQTDELRQKQQILEQELQRLRQQQNDLLARNNQQQNFNQFDPIFTEPDRTVVTKLAAIDPSDILNAAQQGPVLNKFTANEAIMPLQLNPAPSEVKPPNNGEVSLVPSISFDPLVEAGKLPDNGKLLPNKEPTGFHSFVALPKQPVFNSGFTASVNSFNQLPVQNIVQPSVSSFNTPFLGSFTNQQSRQEPKQPVFSIVPAQQPFPPKHEFGVFPQANRFLRQENSVLHRPSNNFLAIPQNFNSQQSNRILRNNGFAPNQNPRFGPQTINIQQSVQPFGPQFSQFVKPNPNNRFLRSNHEGTFGTNQNGFQRPLLQHYKYTSSFGFPNRPFQ